MSREIEFRVWGTKEKIYLDPDDLDVQIAFNGEVGGSDCDGCWESWDKDSYVLEQYTGLKDKNGTKIFEGDLWKDDEGYVGEVKDSNYGWIVKDLDHLYDCLAYGHVIGNRHENPDLLEKE